MPVSLAASLLVLLSGSGCAEPEPAADAELARIEGRAEECLALARGEAWDALSACVLVERLQGADWVQVRLEDSSHSQHAELRARALEFLQRLYGSGKSPGSVHAVRMKVGDSDRKPPLPRAMVTYRHGDFDGFEMARVGVTWYWVVTLWD